MIDCPHTGLSVPECSCHACLQAQLERYRPALLSPSISPTLSAPIPIGAGTLPAPGGIAVETSLTPPSP
ncbi:MAG: hypothetical protein M3M99_04370 [Actinomycetota bacterium]|nr:hypothetical protein [Actinomycetota bacterium]